MGKYIKLNYDFEIYDLLNYVNYDLRNDGHSDITFHTKTGNNWYDNYELNFRLGFGELMHSNSSKVYYRLSKGHDTLLKGESILDNLPFMEIVNKVYDFISLHNCDFDYVEYYISDWLEQAIGRSSRYY